MIIAKSINGGPDKKIDEKELTFAPCLYGIIVRDGKILISPQWKSNGYDFPGGHLNLGEKHIDGLIREVREETGFTVRPIKIIDIFTSFFIHPRTSKAEQTIKIYYACEIVDGEISCDGFDEGEKTYANTAKFVTLKELKKMEFACTTQEPLNSIIPYLETILKE